ncbi:hypothetical protein [Natrinema pallidum]|uniref:RelE toxin-related domain-containing protein n=1 Tax=Natrinema pallidum TaxID=69527 RepID=A0A4P9TFX0_9EURY|nr:hypothetical protein [Natrinema pallidum]QCW03597.1 hypothetical protein FGF80_10235 [Natrinema pallidum]
MSAAESPRYFEISISEHARKRWETRSPQPNADPRAAWGDAVPVHYPNLKPPATDARYHEETDLLLLAAADGTLTTCIPLKHRSRDEQQYIRSQVTDDSI